jgi:hypothetical protein
MPFAPQLRLDWSGSSTSVIGTAVVFEVVAGSFTRVGSSTEMIAAGQTRGVTLPMTTISSGTVTGSVTLASASQVVVGIALRARVENLDVSIMAQNTGTAFGFAAPVAPSYPLTVAVWAQEGFWGELSMSCKQVTPSSTGIVVSVPTGPHLTSPVYGATGIDSSSTFSWTPAGGSVFLVRLSQLDASLVFTVNALDIYTSASSVEIPDLTSLGFSLPSATTINWKVLGAVPNPGVVGQTVDDTAALPWVTDCNSTATETVESYFTTL